MELTRARNKEKVKILAKLALNSLLASSKDLPLLFLSSGGSSLEILSGIDKENLGPHLTIGMLDERFSQDPLVNNFLQLKSTAFHRNAKEAGASFIETVPSGEKLDEFAKSFENSLLSWIQSKGPGGKVFITQGIGADGHTAGIMPYPENPMFFKKTFEDESLWVVGYSAKGKSKYPLRITVTMPFLKKVVDATIVYLIGTEKKEALERVLSPQGTLFETPARIIREMKQVKVFTNIY